MAVDCQQPEKEPKMTLYFISQIYFLCLRARKICRPVKKKRKKWYPVVHTTLTIKPNTVWQCKDTGIICENHFKYHVK